MQIAALICILAAVFYRFRVPLFEAVAATILITVVVAQPVGMLLPLTAPVYFTIIIGLTALICVLFRSDPTFQYRLELLPISLFVLSYLLFFKLTQLWPDFVSMGERLRDYALLSGSIDSPVIPKEPWMAGAPLPYYVYWYRLGRVFSVALGLEVYVVYHQLQSFCNALFFTVCFRLFFSVLSFSIPSALFSALLIVFGSNLAGVAEWYYNVPNWWGPSRVIPGAINEFPAWSFLLGDLHPHFLTLSLIPFFMLLTFRALPWVTSIWRAIPFFAVLLSVPSLWLYGADAWELPAWLGLVLCVGLQLLYTKPVVFKGGWRCNWGRTEYLTMSLMILFSIFFYLSCRHISGAHTPLTAVSDPIPITQTVDLFKHFGLPLFLITLASVFWFRQFESRLVFGAISILAFLSQLAAPYIAFLIVLSSARIWIERDPHPEKIIFEAIGLVGLGLVIFPEFFFFNDAYGGENERMNTIFKFYAVAWFLLHGYAFYLCKRTIGDIKVPGFGSFFLYLTEVLILGVFCSFFYEVARKVRPSPLCEVKPCIAGLTSIDKEFPGAANTILELRKLPKGTVLETQGAAYSYTSHISTLSENFAFLGWANHVNLLTRDYAEVTRREKVTADFYTIKNCTVRAEILKREGISYAVVGPLEVKEHAEVTGADFECLKKIIKSGQYRVYSP